MAVAYEATTEVSVHDTRVLGQDAVACAPADAVKRLCWTRCLTSSTRPASVCCSPALLHPGIRFRRTDLSGEPGFLAFAVAPTIGLEPTLPGTATADLAARQIWWLFTALATASGLTVLLASQRASAIAVAVGLKTHPRMRQPTRRKGSRREPRSRSRSDSQRPAMSRNGTALPPSRAPTSRRP
jgi:predicted cobalt transporter CbtA